MPAGSGSARRAAAWPQREWHAKRDDGRDCSPEGRASARWREARRLDLRLCRGRHRQARASVARGRAVRIARAAASTTCSPSRRLRRCGVPKCAGADELREVLRSACRPYADGDAAARQQVHAIGRGSFGEDQAARGYRTSSSSPMIRAMSTRLRLANRGTLASSASSAPNPWLLSTAAETLTAATTARSRRRRLPWARASGRCGQSGCDRGSRSSCRA